MPKTYAILREDGWHIAEWDGECYNVINNIQSGDRLLPSDIKRAVCLPAEDAVDRILWNEAPNESNRAGSIDEIVVHCPEMVHIEQVDFECWWIAIYKDGAESYWMGNFILRDEDLVLDFTEQENNNLIWDREQSHNEEQT